MIKEALILAGGLGTRLRNVIGEIPKPMAPVGEKPFLEYLFIWLEKNGIRKAVVSVGYLSEKITTHFGNRFGNIEIEYCPEPTPLGTGGGMKKAFGQCRENPVLIVNGDSFFDVDISEFYRRHIENESMLSIALKHMENFDRYGTVHSDDTGRIMTFIEKQPMKSGFINGGLYIMDKSVWNLMDFPEKFSFETEVLENFYLTEAFYGFPFEGYFIDIGVPADYERAQTELPAIFS